ncbi:hypothetical protein ECH7EC4206_A2711 [Escherichia coli O157:H7 str. EC4206]|nr:hypothetical protein ECH7EC4206_A2711 [Escherichia coli O157:H7 str. EC4206]
MYCKEKEKGRIAAFYQRTERGILLSCLRKTPRLHSKCV